MDGAAYAVGSAVGTILKLGWSAPDRLIEEAAAVAAKADVAVVFASHRVGEGMDRLSLGLPNDQDALIQAVARANLRTVVVLNSGGPVTMPWLNDVAAVLEMWLPGSVQGPATARLLFGDAEPQGGLPVTFPADETQGPSATPRHYPGTRRADGSLDTAYLEEGVNAGYRYYDVHDQTPLFPFGCGLSYTSFAVEGFGVRAQKSCRCTWASRREPVSRPSSCAVSRRRSWPPASRGSSPSAWRRGRSSTGRRRQTAGRWPEAATR